MGPRTTAAAVQIQFRRGGMPCARRAEGYAHAQQGTWAGHTLLRKRLARTMVTPVKKHGVHALAQASDDGLRE